VPAEMLTITIPPFTTSKHPFFHKDDVTVKVVFQSDMYGFELSEDNCMKRVYVLGFKKDGKGTKGRRSCNTICSSERATKRKYPGACITAIDDEEIVMSDQAKEKLAELCSKKVDSFTMNLAREPKPSKSMTQRAYDELEFPDFDLDFALGDDLEEDSSMTIVVRRMNSGRITCRRLVRRLPKTSDPKGSLRAKWHQVLIIAQ